MRKIVFFILLVGLFACKPSKDVSSVSSKLVIIEKQIDTVLYSRPDSSGLVALLKCDSLGNAYLAEIMSLKTGKASRSEISLKNNVITLDCKVDSMAVYLKMWKQNNTLVDSTATIVTLYKDRPKTKFEALLDKSILILLLTSFLVFIIYVSIKRIM